jgi:hypothetical protein
VEKISLISLSIARFIYAPISASRCGEISLISLSIARLSPPDLADNVGQFPPRMVRTISRYVHQLMLVHPRNDRARGALVAPAPTGAAVHGDKRGRGFAAAVVVVAAAAVAAAFTAVNAL